MGCYPQRIDDPDMTPAERTRVEAVIREGEQDTSDGWMFIVCSDCEGTGRVSWWRTIGRIPRWLWKGARFCVEAHPWAPIHNPATPDARRAWLTFKCAFLCDLRVPVRSRRTAVTRA